MKHKCTTATAHEALVEACQNVRDSLKIYAIWRPEKMVPYLIEVLDHALEMAGEKEGK